MLQRKYIVALGVGLVFVLAVEWLVLHRNPKPRPSSAPTTSQPQRDGG